MNTLARGALSLLAACAMGTGVLAATAAPAVAAPAAASSTLALMVHDQTGAEPRMALLTCQPAGGAHPQAAGACTAVATVNGHLGVLDLNPNGACTREYQPVTASALGYWEGRPVRYSETFSNRCEMLRQTGPIFDF
ncbi:SSI family serine proteinase inhibitor [Couchioplanes caeruleus]|nr:SSI family serine proteinase inhibitor [Couchioplanes caeruleus]ROP28903.1 subtilisin inhibitor-like [Couchioplanes caeruleus]